MNSGFHNPSACDQTSPAWYALYTRHQHEKSAAHILTQKGFEALVPLYSEKHHWGDRHKEVLLPIFPCYLFVRAGMDRKLDILQTPGIFSIVSSVGQPCVVPEQDIHLVRQLSSNPAKVQPHSYLRTGQFVRVRVGPFAGLAGVLTRIKNISRVVLSVELLQKSVALELDASILDPIDSPRESVFQELTESCRIA
jgi:transcription antitermination factor NusG